MTNTAEQIAIDTQDQRNFEVGLHYCAVTKQADKCIRCKLGELPVVDENGNFVQNMLVYANLSETGLKMLISDLQAAPPVLTMASPAETRKKNPYQWLVILQTGQRIYQFVGEDEETPLKAIPFDRIAEFWIIPQDGGDRLPAYGLIKGRGFVKCPNPGAEIEDLSVVCPKEEIEFRYYRKVTITFMAQHGKPEQFPTHLQQIIGWKRGDEICDIAIEPDGSYCVYLREPVDAASYKY